MPRAYDPQQLTVDRDPLRSLDMSIGNLPRLNLDPAAILEAFVASIKDTTGIDLSSVPALIQSLGEALVKFVDFLTSLTDIDTWIGGLAEFVMFFTGLLDRAGFLVVIEEVANFFGGLLDRAGFFDALNDVIGFFTGILDRSGFLAALESITGQDLVDSLWSALNGGATAINKTLGDALDSLGVFAGELIRNLTGNPLADALGDVGVWASGLLNRGLSWGDLAQIFGQIPASILGVIPVPGISLIEPELMAQGGFDTSTTLTPGSGWSWSTDTYSGSTGSAKVDGNGTDRRLYSNQSIEVAEGDKLIVSCWVKSTGTVGANGIVLSVVEFNGTTQGTTRTIAARASSAGWVQIGNSSALPYTVGAGVTSIRVQLGITAAAAAGSAVWFDDISVKKVGLMSGNWVTGFLGTIAEDIEETVKQIVEGIVGIIPGGVSLISGAANSIAGVFRTFFERLFGIGQSILPGSLSLSPLVEDAIPGLSASKIVEGEVNADHIPDITRDMSTDLQGNIDALVNGYRRVAGTDWSITDSASVATDISDAVTTLNQSVAALESEAAAGSFSGNSAAEDFSAYTTGSTLGDGWSQAGAGLGISPIGFLGYPPNGAKFTTTNYCKAVYTTEQSATDIQKVGIVAAGSPATVSNGYAYNYIYARMNATGTQYVFAKFRANRAEIGYNAGSGEQIIGGIAHNFIAGSTYWLLAGTSGAAARTFQIQRNGVPVLTLTDAAAASVMGSSNLYVGFGGVGADGPGGSVAYPSPVASLAFYDNIPPAYRGSGFKAYKSANNYTITTNGDQRFPNSFFDTEAYKTNDYTYTPATANKLEATTEGWYHVEIACGLTINSMNVDMALTLWKNGALFQRAGSVWGVSQLGRGPAHVHGSFIVYLQPGDYIQPGYWQTTIYGADGQIVPGQITTYFSASLINKSQ